MIIMVNRYHWEDIAKSTQLCKPTAVRVPEVLRFQDSRVPFWFLGSEISGSLITQSRSPWSLNCQTANPLWSSMPNKEKLSSCKHTECWPQETHGEVPHKSLNFSGVDDFWVWDMACFSRFSFKKWRKIKPPDFGAPKKLKKSIWAMVNTHG